MPVDVFSFYRRSLRQSHHYGQSCSRMNLLMMVLSILKTL
uniref:Uncharacterized protein n=1 Tax=Arundo donax TaxID=35708 RepID=A0A0A9CWP6_ARUDO